MTHWHVDKVTGHSESASGPVGDCCDGFLKYGEAPSRPECPECSNGKHGNCTGWALNEATDEIVDCFCETCATDRAEKAAVVEERGREWSE